MTGTNDKSEPDPKVEAARLAYIEARAEADTASEALGVAPDGVFPETDAGEEAYYLHGRA